MNLRQRNCADQLHTDTRNTNHNMPDTYINGNKVSDVNIPYVTSPEDKIAAPSMNGEKVQKCSSFSSDDSKVQLTDDESDTTCGCDKKGAGCTAIKLAICLVCGVIFGIMFVKGRGKWCIFVYFRNYSFMSVA